jgi:hypothetical protein
MDTKTLAVGQKVWMRSGPYTKEATVIDVTDYRVAVELASGEEGGLAPDGERCAIHFTRNGKPGTIFEKVRQCGVFYHMGNSWYERDIRPACTEFGPWELVDSIC